MTTKDEMVTRVVRVTLPTASFSLKRSQIEWIEEQAAKIGRNQRSEFMRRLIDKAMKEEDAA
jgi:hypothetical protein